MISFTIYDAPIMPISNYYSIYTEVMDAVLVEKKEKSRDMNMHKRDTRDFFFFFFFFYRITPLFFHFSFFSFSLTISSRILALAVGLRHFDTHLNNA